MNASATSFTRAAVRVLRWSSTGHARARPNRWPASLPALHSSPSAIVMGARAKLIGLTSTPNHPTATPPRLAPTPIVAVKSP
jgi:hypothetical protein